ncbi:alpha-helical ferredoxin [Lucifera butyrica]|uniref:Alpha-helical ferredoxin n=1 Tax=Lucifera butyrica TaxID=1351585 RepID=A0A498R8E3_9FIRM|nr:epoxyqueuosine reductase [Lucifera butyrica]VBB07245.1 alpha-helical ferredoxin [Lucifera butyrica]
MDIINIEEAINEFWSDNPLNIVKDLNSLQIFDKPLIGVASAYDPLFEQLKEETAVGPHHMSPQEWLPGSQSVISYFLPFTEEVRTANRRMGQPAREWLYGRIEGQQYNNALCQFLVRWFTAAGYEAVGPSVDKRFQVTNKRSNWSERHVAFIAGLGTLSLSCSIITKRGSAGRLGSVIVNTLLESTPRYYTEKDENCTKCGACILRCPPLAINENGKNHAVCSDYLDRVLARFSPRYGCGKCQTGVPCETKIPDKARIGKSTAI